MADPLVDLVGTSEVTAYLTDAGLTAPSDLDAIITGVSATMQEYASRNFVSQPYSQVLNGHGGDRVSLPNYPITAVSALAIDGVTIQAAATPVAAGFVFSETQVLLRCHRFGRGVQNVALTYTAGFSPIPADLRRAACEAIAAVVAALGYDDPRVVEIAAGGTKMKFANGTVIDLAAICFTPSVTSVLNQRRRVVPA